MSIQNEIIDEFGYNLNKEEVLILIKNKYEN